MASRLRSILEAVKTAVQAVNGAGSYVHDLSATGVVQLGEPTIADGASGPRVWVWLDSLVGEDGPVLGERKRLAVIGIRADVPATSASHGEQMLIACDVLNDITTALDADRGLSGTVLDLNVAGCPLAGQSLGLTGMATAILSVEAYVHLPRGY